MVQSSSGSIPVAFIINITFVGMYSKRAKSNFLSSLVLVITTGLFVEIYQINNILKINCFLKVGK